MAGEIKLEAYEIRSSWIQLGLNPMAAVLWRKKERIHRPCESQAEFGVSL